MVPMSIKSSYYLDLAATLARNSNTPDYALLRIAERVTGAFERQLDQAKCFQVSVALCCNPHTPFVAITTLLAQNQCEIELRKLVAQETKRQDVLRLLQSDRSELVRKQAHKSSENIALVNESEDEH
jgi:hypothetical protein